MSFLDSFTGYSCVNIHGSAPKCKQVNPQLLVYRSNLPPRHVHMVMRLFIKFHLEPTKGLLVQLPRSTGRKQEICLTCLLQCSTGINDFWARAKITSTNLLTGDTASDPTDLNSCSLTFHLCSMYITNIPQNVSCMFPLSCRSLAASAQVKIILKEK